MAVPFATVDDVAEGWAEPLTVEQERMVQRWLETASNNLRLIGRKLGIDIDTYIQGDDVLIMAARDAVVESVRRRLMNPNGIRQRSISQGATPYSETNSETVDNTLSSGRLYFLDDELQWLPSKPRQPFRTLHAKSGYYK
ncbi:Gp19/Gp15/Gp42 family protein [Glutamicibacter sp. X7]